MTIEDAKERVACLEKTIKDKTNELQRLNRAVAKQKKEQQRLLSEVIQEKQASGQSATAAHPMDVDDDGYAMAGIDTQSQMDIVSSQVKDGRPNLNPDDSTSDSGSTSAYESLIAQRKIVQSLREAVGHLGLELKDLKEEKYALNKFTKDQRASPTSSMSAQTDLKGKQKSAHIVSKGKRRSTATGETSTSTSATSTSANASQPTGYKSPYTSTPSLLRPGTMDYVEATCIDQLKKEIAENNKKHNSRKITLVPGGTDPGAKVLFETVAVPEADLIKLQNRFKLLSEDDISPSDAIADQAAFDETLETSRKGALAQIKLPKPHKTTVGNLRHLSGLTGQARRRSLATKANDHIEATYAELGKHSPHRANTVADLKVAASVRRKAREEVHNFEWSKSKINMRSNVSLRLSRTYDYVASKERQIFQKVAQGKSNTISVLTLFL